MLLVATRGCGRLRRIEIGIHNGSAVVAIVRSAVIPPEIAVTELVC
jgi:hypothetical protein